MYYFLCQMALIITNWYHMGKQQPSVQKDVTVKWKQNNIPSNYSINGSILCAAMGRNWGRSIAVANSRGICVLDLTKGNGRDLNIGRYDLPTSCTSAIRSDLGSSAKLSTYQSKWKMLTEVEERQVSVQAMTWWERDGNDGSSEDLLICSVKYVQSLSKKETKMFENG